MEDRRVSLRPVISEIKCDECGQGFPPKQIKRRKEGEIETTYFTCSECGHEYPVCRTNPELRKLAQRIANKRKRIDKLRGTGPAVREHLREFWDLEKEYKIKLGEFNGVEKKMVQ